MTRNNDRLRVLALEPYFVLSHKTFLEGYQRFSKHAVEIWSMPARKWKWRMRGAAYHFVDRARSASAGEAPDVVLASDFLNLADWLALAPPRFKNAPAILYFHENQVTYPLGEEAPKDHQYGWINLGSALAAKIVLFNSHYHQEAFLQEVERILEKMPDFVPEGLAESVRRRSEVFPVGIDFTLHRSVLGEGRRRGSTPTIVWNHRWEYDKNPNLMASALTALRAEGLHFRAVVCGQAFKSSPSVFAELPRQLGDRLAHLGFYSDALDYLRALRDADIVLSTARHEFFGVSVVEAMYMGCLPMLPHNLSYPEILPRELHSEFLYADEQDLLELLRQLIRRVPVEREAAVHNAASRFDWERLAPRLDAIVEQTLTAEET